MATRSVSNKSTQSEGRLTDREKVAVDDERWEADRHTNVMLAGIKGLAVLNGAGVAAMLAFTQALLSKADVWMRFKPFGVTSLTLFFIGAAAASLLFYPFARALADPANRLSHISVGSHMLGATVACLLLGAGAAVAGIWIAL